MELTNDGRIYAVNPNQIKDLLNIKEKAIVYRWLPYNMKNYVPIILSESYYDRKERKNEDDCPPIPLDILQSYCDKNNIELYVITNEYATAFTEINSINNPMFSMSIGSYIKDISEKFEDQFYKELIGNKYDKDKFIYYFENGEFVRIEDEILNEKWKE